MDKKIYKKPDQSFKKEVKRINQLSKKINHFKNLINYLEKSGQIKKFDMPKNYYYNQFRKDLLVFLQEYSLVHRHGEDTSIPICNKLSDNNLLEKIENKTYFLSALVYTVLIDQAIYSYFINDYEKFKKITMYPKFEVGATTSINATPWSIFQYIKKVNISKFEDFTKFFINDLKEFFTKNCIGNITWEELEKYLAEDEDIFNNTYGKIFINNLKN